MKNFHENLTIIRRLLCLLVVLSVITISCTYEHSLEIKPEKVSLSFRADNNKITTRSLQADEINEIEALVFVENGSEYTFRYRVSATAIADAGNNLISFDLDLSEESSPAKIYFVANGKNALDNSNMQTGDSEAIAKTKIIATSSLDGMNSVYPLWGEYNLPSGIHNSNSPQIIPILPAVARIDIESNISTDTFHIVSIQGYRVNEQIQIVPNAYTDSMTVSQPSVPALSPVINTTPIAVTGNLSQNQLFFPESEAQSNSDKNLKATCLIVGGKFNNSPTTTYYRLDFEPTTPNTLTGQILRDRLYTFEIKKVTSPGWETPDDAAKNIPTNIQVEMNDWADVGIDISGNASGGGTYYINISSRLIELSDTIGSKGSILIYTNILDYKIQWCDASGVPIGEPANSLNDGDFAINATRYAISATALKDNSSGSNIEKHFMILGKRSNIIITLRQLP